jgi:hypothetical protein
MESNIRFVTLGLAKVCSTFFENASDSLAQKVHASRANVAVAPSLWTAKLFARVS